MKHPELIVMLTYHDHTVENARTIFEECKNTKARYWGLKEDGLPLQQMKSLFADMKACGKTTVLEVVAYTEQACLDGARMAAECRCDILMGTLYYDSVNQFCREHGLKYMPFVGKITGRPSVLDGTIEEMVSQAKKCLEKGVYGFDLLGYRYTGDPEALNRAFVAQIDAPVCLAGSINSYRRLDEVREAAPWTFTIGGAFFENRFGGTFAEQIDKVCQYMER